MKLVYGKQFSKDLANFRLDENVKKRLLELIDKIKIAESLSELNHLRKIEGYAGYYRIRFGDYRLGIKVDENRVEMIRFLHRKDIYRRFP
jgi:mRNA interferase RelE/StbE